MSPHILVTVCAVRCVCLDLCLLEYIVHVDSHANVCVQSRLCVSKLVCVSLDRCRAAGLMTWGVADFPLPIWILSLVPNRVWHSLSTWLLTGWALWQTKAGRGNLCISSGCNSTWMLSDWEEFPYWQTASANMHHECLNKHTLRSMDTRHTFTRMHSGNSRPAHYCSMTVQRLSSQSEVCCETQNHPLASTTPLFQIPSHPLSPPFPCLALNLPSLW